MSTMFTRFAAPIARKALAVAPRRQPVALVRGISQHNLRRVPSGLPPVNGSSTSAAVDEATTSAAGVISVGDFTVTSPHARVTSQGPGDYSFSHSVYTPDEVERLDTKVRFTPGGFRDRVAQKAITAVRGTFDFLSGYSRVPGKMTEEKYITRAIFLETVAAVPGMVGSMVRHFESLRLMRRDHGWIHTLIGEAENERMHLLTFLELKKPGVIMRGLVLLAQGVFFNGFFISYMLSPRTCHRFVGFLEEEAVATYTRIVEDIDAGHLPNWAKMAAPPLAVAYWRLAPTATMRDVILSIRADEAIHRDVNHVFGSLSKDANNPFH